jgi:co-chaperonin GroES (HSP10)
MGTIATKLSQKTKVTNNKLITNEKNRETKNNTKMVAISNKIALGAGTYKQKLVKGGGTFFLQQRKC